MEQHNSNKELNKIKKLYKNKYVKVFLKRSIESGKTVSEMLYLKLQLWRDLYTILAAYKLDLTQYAYIKMAIFEYEQFKLNAKKCSELAKDLLSGIDNKNTNDTAKKLFQEYRQEKELHWHNFWQLIEAHLRDINLEDI